MSWSKVRTDFRKPIGWWYHKIMCEICYYFRRNMKWYYHHIDAMCEKYGLNLYGEKFPPLRKKK